MALQGTLDTFELPDVLRLLATTSKTGLLALEGDRGVGNIWFRDGSIVGAVSDLEQIDGPDAVVFDLLRMDGGTFVFDPDADVEERDGAFEVADVLDSAQAKLAEWREIEAVVPTLDVFARLIPEIEQESVVVTKDNWRLLAMLGAGTTIRRLGERMELREVPISRLVKDLVEAGFVVLEESVTGGSSGLVLPPMPTIHDLDDADQDDSGDVDEPAVDGVDDVQEAAVDDDTDGTTAAATVAPIAADDPDGAASAAAFAPPPPPPPPSGHRAADVDATADVALAADPPPADLPPPPPPPAAADIAADEPTEPDTDEAAPAEDENKNLLLRFLSSVKD